MNKKAQVTAFIIIAIVIVVLATSFFVFKGQIVEEKIPSTFEPLERSFLACIEDTTMTGVSILSTQGGYIETPKFVPGSDYMPFSSQLEFFGVEIPYWHYISGNNLDTVQVPEVKDMEESLEAYLEEEITGCDLKEYRDQGYIFEIGSPKVNARIKDDAVEVDVESDLVVQFQGESAIIKDHNVGVDSKLGKLYESAKEVYETQEETLFLENYSIDVMRNYLPVDGIELSCSPVTWNANDLYDEFTYALESNIYAIKNEGAQDDYFALNLPIEEETKFIFFKDWPNTFEVSPADTEILTATPVGTQAGLGIIGFCYVPYHFVYNIRFPVLVQVSEGEEIFQFPVTILIEGNLPRESRAGESAISELPNLCDEESNTKTQVTVLNNDLEKVDALVSFECFSSTCQMGVTENGVVQSNLPQCVNGKVVVEAEGYAHESMDYTSVEEGDVIIILDKEYEKEIELVVDGQKYDGYATVNFISDTGSTSLVYPDQTKAVLSEGEYDIQVQLFKDSELTLPPTTREECNRVPRSGVAGAIGLTKEECVDVEVPEQIVSNALVGGGTDSYYFLDRELDESSSISLGVSEIAAPKSLEDLQTNYILFETYGVEVEFR